MVGTTSRGARALIIASLLATAPGIAGANAPVTTGQDLRCLEEMTALPPEPCLPTGDGAQDLPVPCVPVPVVVGSCPAWSAIYDHPGGHATTGIDIAFAVATTDETSFVVGQSWSDATNSYDYAIVAYDLATGAERYRTRWRSTNEGHHIPSEAILDAAGERLFITGHAGMTPIGEDADYGTIAVDTVDGSVLWEARYDGYAGSDDAAYGIALSPDEQTVYVTGKSGEQHGDVDFATVAYDANDGTETWVARWGRTPGGGEDIGISILPSENAVTIIGAGAGMISAVTYGAAGAIDAGEVRWETIAGNGYGYYGVRDATDGTIYIAGSRHLGAGSLLLPNWDMAVLALDPNNGTVRWEARYGSPDKGLDIPYAIALSPDGATVAISGVATASTPSGIDLDAAIVAFSTAGGQQRWVDRTTTPGHISESLAALAITPDSRTIAAVGWSASPERGDALAMSFDLATGTPGLRARYNTQHSVREIDVLGAMTLSPDGSRFVATGYAQLREVVSLQGAQPYQMLTVAYDLS